MSERICPHCQMVIYDPESLSCHHCGESMKVASSGMMGFFNRSGTKAAVVIIVMIIVASFLMTVF